MSDHVSTVGKLLYEYFEHILYFVGASMILTTLAGNGTSGSILTGMAFIAVGWAVDEFNMK